MVTIEVKIPAVALGLRRRCCFVNTAHQESDSKTEPGVCVLADPTGTLWQRTHSGDMGDTHRCSPIPCTAHPAHSTEPNAVSRSCTPQHCMELWGGNHGTMGLVPVHPQCPPCCRGARHVRGAELCAVSGPFVPSPDGGSDAAQLQPSASPPSPPLPPSWQPSPHQELTLGQELGWEGRLELEGGLAQGTLYPLGSGLREAKGCWEMESPRCKWHLGPGEGSAGVGAQRVGGVHTKGVHELGSTVHSVP